MKIIFLDIDGVLNCENAYLSGECQYVHWINDNGEKDYHQAFCPWSKELLNSLIEKTNASIVITSTWRSSGIEWLRNVWKIEKMSGEIIGITPSLRTKGLDIPRGMEIAYYLNYDLLFRHINWDKVIQQQYIETSGVENYIIIDDDSDMLYNQRNHFVHVLPSPRNKDGFNEPHYEQALEILSKTIIDLNY